MHTNPVIMYFYYFCREFLDSNDWREIANDQWKLKRANFWVYIFHRKCLNSSFPWKILIDCIILHSPCLNPLNYLLLNNNKYTNFWLQ